MKLFPALLFFSFVTLNGLWGEELSKSALQNLKQIAQKAADSQKNNDPLAMLEIVPQKLIDLVGGKEKFIETLERTQKNFEREQVIIQKVQVSDPISFSKGTDGWYALVPIELTLSIKENLVRNQSHLLAFSPDDGKTWQLIDTSGIKTPKDVLKIFPGYPKDLKIPKPIQTKP